MCDFQVAQCICKFAAQAVCCHRIRCAGNAGQLKLAVEKKNSL